MMHAGGTAVQTPTPRMRVRFEETGMAQSEARRAAAAALAHEVKDYFFVFFFPYWVSMVAPMLANMAFASSA